MTEMIEIYLEVRSAELKENRCVCLLVPERMASDQTRMQAFTMRVRFKHGGDWRAIKYLGRKQQINVQN